MLSTSTNSFLVISAAIPIHAGTPTDKPKKSNDAVSKESLTLSPLPRTCRTVVGTGRVFWRPVGWMAAPALFRRASLPEGGRERSPRPGRTGGQDLESRDSRTVRKLARLGGRQPLLIDVSDRSLVCVPRIQGPLPMPAKRLHCCSWPKTHLLSWLRLPNSNTFLAILRACGYIRLHICPNSRHMVTALRSPNRNRCNFRGRVTIKTFQSNRFRPVCV